MVENLEICNMATHSYKKAKDEENLTMRSIRRAHSTLYVQLVAEANELGIQVPPNPLQHRSGTKTALKHYASNQADHPYRAQDRLIAAGKRDSIRHNVKHKFRTLFSGDVSKATTRKDQPHDAMPDQSPTRTGPGAPRVRMQTR